MQSNLTDQYQTISNWGIIKDLHQYNDACQVLHIHDSVGDGYFENYDFDSLNLARLNCHFHNQYTLPNAKMRYGYWIYIILQGRYQMYSAKNKQQYELLSPCILLLKGDLGEMVASIPADTLINSFYIEFNKDYFAKLQQQLQNNPNYQYSILRHFFHQNEPYCFIPLTAHSKDDAKTDITMDTTCQATTKNSQNNIFNAQIISNPIATQIIEKSWILYNGPKPTDEISLMSLQGATYSFVSEFLMQSFSKLYQFDLQANEQFDFMAMTNSKPDNEFTDNLAHTTAHETVHNANHKQTIFDDSRSLYAVQAKLLLDQFYYENWTICQLAKRVHTNECYLKKDFKALTGQTIGEYRKQKRMQQAVILLAKEFKTIEIANQLGFNSHDYFLKTFQKFYHCSPDEYLVSSIITND